MTHQTIQLPPVVAAVIGAIAEREGRPGAAVLAAAVADYCRRQHPEVAAGVRRWREQQRQARPLAERPA